VSRYYTFTPDELKALASDKSLSHELSKQTKISKIEISVFNKLPEIHITVPIYDSKEQIRGILDVSVNVARMWELISRYRIGKDRYAYVDAYVVDSQGSLLAYQEVSSKLRKTDVKGIEIVKKLLRGEIGVYEYEGLEGGRVIGANAMIPSTGWGVVEEMMIIRPDIPVILCTGYNERVTKEKAMAMGICAFVAKPVTIRDIAETVHRVLSRR
jgi:CheY-like chemotaxis protein